MNLDVINFGKRNIILLNKNIIFYVSVIHLYLWIMVYKIYGFLWKNNLTKIYFYSYYIMCKSKFLQVFIFFEKFQDLRPFWKYKKQSYDYWYPFLINNNFYYLFIISVLPFFIYLQTICKQWKIKYKFVDLIKIIYRKSNSKI